MHVARTMSVAVGLPWCGGPAGGAAALAASCSARCAAVSLRGFSAASSAAAAALDVLACEPLAAAGLAAGLAVTLLLRLRLLGVPATSVSPRGSTVTSGSVAPEAALSTG